VGIDLYLLPLECESPPYSHTILRATADHRTYDKIEALESQPVPDDFSCYLAHGGENGKQYGFTDVDSYGRQLRTVRAGPLAAILHRWGFRPATTAYLQALKPNTKIVLFWS